MDKILSWLESFKSFFSSEVAKISSAQAELVSVNAALATANSTVAERDAKIVSLTADLEKAQNEVNAKGAQVKSLTDELATEKNRATEAIAGQGLPADKLPEGGSPETKSAQQQIESIRAKIAATSDPKEKSRLCNQINEMLSKAKN